MGGYRELMAERDRLMRQPHDSNIVETARLLDRALLTLRAREQEIADLLKTRTVDASDVKIIVSAPPANGPVRVRLRRRSGEDGHLILELTTEEAGALHDSLLRAINHTRTDRPFFEEEVVR